ncbi:MAG: M23 family metallopeptidase [Actinomycetota bacterium]|nr:M23 family metallopeptidase [Actinomycetota bacterium]
MAGFDPPEQNWNAGHRGVDLQGRPGQRVRAAKAGRITYAGLLAGRGIVVVSHGATRTTYQPVDAGARVGTNVSAGETVGRLRTFGSHCFPRTCLHWGLIRGETYLNPLTLVGAAPVRLLPFYGDLGASGSIPAFPVRPLTPVMALPMLASLAESALARWQELAASPRPADEPVGMPGAAGPW